jgi:PBP1b-binding outer membrane lipoprotein LpoB
MYRKSVILVLALAMLFAGCSAVNSFLCKPTANQTLAANVGVALIQAALTAASVYTGNPIALALSSNAKPVFDKVVAGYCVAQVDWDNAVATLQQAQTQPDMAAKMISKAKAMNVENPVSFLDSVRWGK